MSKLNDPGAAPRESRTPRNPPNPSIWAIFARLYEHLSLPRRRELRWLVGLMVLGAIAELTAVGAVFPFLQLLTDPAQASRTPLLSQAIAAIGVADNRQLLLIATVLFIGTAIAAAVIRIWLAWATNSFTYNAGHEFAVEIQRRILYQDYMYHVSHNSGEVVASLQKVSTFVHGVFLQLMAATVSFIISFFIIAGLLYIDWKAALTVGASFVLIYSLVMFFSRRRLAHFSEEMAEAYSLRVKLVQEGLGAVRDIIVDKMQPVYVEAFRQVDRRLSTALSTAEFLGASPRFAIEAGGMLVLALVAYSLAQGPGGLMHAIPVIGVLALGAQRLLPLLQQLYVTWNSLSSRKAIARDIVDLLDLPVPVQIPSRTVEALDFDEAIRLERVTFAYPGQRKPILEDMSLTIRRGSRVALVGRSGSGKSTFLDVIMGLLKPTGGQILVDDEPLTDANLGRWQRNIAHVPQAIFLADTSIAQNICLGESHDEIDWGRLEAAARRAQLLEFVSSLPQGFETEIGERGIRLSGGQRQRLGIARALYKDAVVIIFDEATNALDSETEAAVMKSLDELGTRTIIIVSHRLSSIATCDQVISLEKGRIAHVAAR